MIENTMKLFSKTISEKWCVNTWNHVVLLYLAWYWLSLIETCICTFHSISGADSGGGAPRPGCAPPKIGKNMIFFGVKSWFFTWNTPKVSRAPPKIGKIWFFGVKSWFFTWNTPKIFAPPSALRNFFKCAPLTWNPGSASEYYPYLVKQWRFTTNNVELRFDLLNLSAKFRF